MSLEDYCVDNDEFVLDESHSIHVFPCNVCQWDNLRGDEIPCLYCGHNPDNEIEKRIY